MEQQNYWFDQNDFEQKIILAKENSSESQSHDKKKSEKRFGFGTLIACMLITALLGGVMGGILFQGSQQNISLPGNQQAIVDNQKDKEQQNATTSPDNGVQTEKPSENLLIQPTTQDGYYNSTQVAALASPSIVGIDVESTQNSWFGPQTTTGSGSGIIVTTDGYIITNNHVIEGAHKVTVYLSDDSEYEARLVGTDARTDLAVIKIDATGLTPVTMGNSDALVVGESVMAIGNPLGELRGSATGGMISALARTIVVENQEMTLLQTDAAINPGNSGGGLFNMKGELVGVVNAKVASSSTEGLGFAIPVNDARKVVTDLMDQGYVGGRAYLGVYTQPVLLQSNNVDGRNGNSFFGDFFGGGMMMTGETRVQVVQVVVGSAANEAGIQAGDLILKIDDHEITTNNELTDAIDEYEAGDTATITIQRNSEKIELSVTFGEYVPEL